MPTYVVLMNWTEKGIAAFKDSAQRAAAAEERLRDIGITLKDIYWTVGPHDIVCVFDAADDETLAAGLLTLGAMGYTRGTTMRAFSRSEFEQVVGRTG